jgi:erythromycin esterase-like protein
MDTTLEDVMRYIRTKTTLAEAQEIGEALRARCNTLSRMSAFALHSGQAVSFSAKNGRKVTGIVQRVKQKTVEIRANDGTRWNVDAVLVSPINL